MLMFKHDPVWDSRSYELMTNLGAVFQMAPTKMGPVTIAVLDDTCGNFIQLLQK
jgi:hypothetical protein